MPGMDARPTAVAVAVAVAPLTYKDRYSATLLRVGSAANARRLATGPSCVTTACAKHPAIAAIAIRPCFISATRCHSNPAASSDNPSGSNGAPPGGYGP